MSLQGDAVIAIWQDLVPEAKQDFCEWHNRQHVSERLSIPGFLRARRFVAVEGGPEFYTLYELDCVETAASREYLDRLNAPTDWTRRIMPSFRNMARSACRVVHSSGLGDGGFLMTLRCADSKTLARNLPALLDQAGIVGVHLCVADNAASGIATFEKTFRTTADLVPACVAMIEGTSAEYVGRAAARLSAQGAETALYRVEHSASAADMASSRHRRRVEFQHAPA